MTTEAPPARRGAAEQARVDDALRNRIRNVAFNAHVGIDAESIEPQQARVRFEMRPTLIGTTEHRRLHGGVIATALDDVGGLALMVALADKHAAETAEQLEHRYARMGTINLRVDYLRQGHGDHFVASAEVTRLGARIGLTLMRLVNDQGVLIATGAGNYILS